MRTVSDPPAPQPQGDEHSTGGPLPAQDTESLVVQVWAGFADTIGDPSATIRLTPGMGGVTSPVELPPSLRMFPKPRNNQVAKRGTAIDPKADFILGMEIGQGGMGVVHRARQNSLGRLVAVKLLHPKRTADDESRSKFFAEAAVTAELDHPGIIPVYDMGINADGVPFYAMKLVKGTPWQDVLSTKSQLDNLAILLRVGDAIAYAHSKGVIHRDLKPNNIMIGEFGEVQVLDWGFAVAVSPGNHAMPLDRSNSIAGTPAYMAPEMALGQIERIGVWTDVYQLGGILYNILTGKLPHVGKDRRAVLIAAADNDIAPCAHGGELEIIARRAMATDPAQRYAGVREFQQAIREYLEHHESVALGDRAGEALESARRSGHYGEFVRAQSAFRDALVLWPENTMAKAGLSETERAYAQQAFDRADFDLAESLLDPQQADHRQLLGAVVVARVERRSRQQMARRLRTAAWVLAACLCVSLIGGAWLAWSKERQLATEQQRATLAELAAAEARVEAQKKMIAAEQIELANTKRIQQRARAFLPYSEAMDLLLRGREFVAADERLVAAIAIDPDFIEAHFAQGEALRMSGRPHLATVSYLKANELGQRITGKPHLRALLLAGFAAGDAGNYRQAEELFLQVQGQGKEDPLATVSDALLLASRSKFAEAMVAAEAAVQKSPNLWEAHYAVGCVAVAAVHEGCADAAQTLIKGKAALRQATVLSPTQPNPRIFLVRLLRLSVLAEDQAELERLAAHPDPQLEDQPITHADRVVALVYAGDVAGAESAFQQVLQRQAPPAVILGCEALIAASKKDLETAFGKLRTIIHNHGAWPPLVEKWVRLGLRLKTHRAEVTEFFTQWEPSHRDLPTRFALAAYLAVLANDLTTANREIQAGLALAPYSRELQHARAYVLRMTKQWQPLLDALRSTMGARPPEFELRAYELEALVRLRRFTEAGELATTIEREFPARAGDIASLRTLITAGAMFGR